MEIFFQVQSKWKVDIAIAFAWETEGVDESCHYLLTSAPWLGISPAWRDFGGKKNEKIVLYGPPAMEISRVMVVGLGKMKSAKPVDVRHAFAKALCACRDMGLDHVGVDIVSLNRIASHIGYTKEEIAREISLAAHLALYSYTKYKQKSETKVLEVRKMSFLLDDVFCSDELKEAVRYAEAEASGICLARDLSNAPGNDITPVRFADEAEKVALEHGIKCTVLNQQEIENEGMHAFLAVGQGSFQESRFVVLEYTPKGLEKAEKEARPIALVGKGITFDAGGISLKPGAGMHEMKADMSGAAAVLGTFETLGQLAKLGIAPKKRIIGLIPLAENMPDGNALKPGDIVYSKKGKSIEILNTDAEGRLVLIDALAYAEEKFNPLHLLDIATLTGACAIALGNNAAGVFSTEDALGKYIQDIGEKLFERTWHLPLWDSFLKGLESNVADLANIGPREGGALIAAIFLKQFIDENRSWVHIDMAAAENGDDAVTPKGTTGFGVRLLTDFALADFSFLEK